MENIHITVGFCYAPKSSFKNINDCHSNKFNKKKKKWNIAVCEGQIKAIRS